MTPGLSKDIRGVTYDHTILNSTVQRGQRDHYEGERERWVDLGRLMTPGVSKDIWCHV